MYCISFLPICRQFTNEWANSPILNDFTDYKKKTKLKITFLDSGSAIGLIRDRWSHDHCYYFHHDRGHKASFGFSFFSLRGQSSAHTHRRPLPMNSRQIPAVFYRCNSLHSGKVQELMGKVQELFKNVLNLILITFDSLTFWLLLAHMFIVNGILVPFHFLLGWCFPEV